MARKDRSQLVAEEIIIVTLRVQPEIALADLIKAWPKIPKGTFLAALDTLSLSCDPFPIYQTNNGKRIGRWDQIPPIETKRIRILRPQAKQLELELDEEKQRESGPGQRKPSES